MDPAEAAVGATGSDDVAPDVTDVTWSLTAAL
jgi:hypothetical protein